MARLIEELKRRHVFKVMASYAVIAWVLIQVIVAIEEPLGLPAWSDTLVIVSLIIGLPICAVLAWIYDITSHGIRRTGIDEIPSTSAAAGTDNWTVGVAIAASALLAVTSAYLVLGNPGRTLDTLAVLPFEHAGDDATAPYLGTGIRDSLIVRLSRISNLRIKSGAARGQNDDPQALGRALGVAAICTGRIVEHGDTLEIVAELIATGDGSIIWREEYSSQAASLIGIQTAISAEIARQLGFELSREEEAALARAPTNNPAAYRLYLQGRYFWNRRTAEGFAASIEHYERAIDLDPNYALAYSGLAHTYLMRFGWGLEPPEAIAPLVEENAERAIRLDSTLAEPYAARAYLKTLYDRDWDGARQDFLRAIELNANYSTAHHWYAFLLMTEGDMDAAVEEMLLARELEPLSPIINAEVGYFYLFAGDHARAIEALQAASTLDPNYPSTVRNLMRAYALLGRREDALAQVERWRSLDGDSLHSTAYGAVVLPLLGLEDEARRIYERATAAAEEIYMIPGLLGLLAAALGRHDEAYAHFEAALQERSLVLSWLRDPLLEDLHDDPRLAELFERVGLQL